MSLWLLFGIIAEVVELTLRRSPVLVDLYEDLEEDVLVEELL